MMPIEQSRWNQANIDTLFYAGCQEYVNRYYGLANNNNFNKFYFNLLQQPVNMVTGYQMQHRKNFNYIPHEGSDPRTTDQYNKLMTNVCNMGDIHQQFSRGCEQACITGMVLLQPYLDYTTDPAQGDMRVKVWEYNSFLCDPFARSHTFEDSQYVWTQEYISKKEAEERFPDKKQQIYPMVGTPQRFGRFYFLPENYQMSRNDLMVLSYIWYKSKRKKKQLYSEKHHQFFDFGGGQEQLEQIMYGIPELQIVEVEVPTWKLATVLNDQIVYQGNNPLQTDACPFIPMLWNYEPHINYYDLRCRGLVRTMRDSNYLLNRRIIINHDISEATVNAGWMRKIGAVANEDNLKKSGQGWDIIINDGFEMTDVTKIIPTEVPASDMALADQLQQLIFSTSGINLETWSAQDDVQASSLTVMLKQAANLMVLQKFFDQWDLSLKTLGDRMLQIALNNWTAGKVQLLIGEEPTEHFYSRIFAKYQITVEEGMLTPVQANNQAKQLLDLNQIFGREVFPPSMIVPLMNLSNKADIIEFLQGQEQQMQAAQSEAQNIEHAMQEAQLKETMSKSVNNIASAKERYGRYESDLGLKDERESELTKNRALATKAKMEALEKMVDVTAKLGAIETMVKMGQIEDMQNVDIAKEDAETQKSQEDANQNEFLSKMMSDMPGTVAPQQPGQPQ
jgi:hypothetical protein